MAVTSGLTVLASTGLECVDFLFDYNMLFSFTTRLIGLVERLRTIEGRLKVDEGVSLFRLFSHRVCRIENIQPLEGLPDLNPYKARLRVGKVIRYRQGHLTLVSKTSCFEGFGTAWGMANCNYRLARTHCRQDMSIKQFGINTGEVLWYLELLQHSDLNCSCITRDSRSRQIELLVTLQSC